MFGAGVRQTVLNSETSGQLIEAVVRAGEVFGAALRQRDVGVSGLSRDLGLPKATVGRILRSLLAGGLLEQDQTNGRYRVSSLVTSQVIALNYSELADIATPFLTRVRDVVNETVGLFVRVGQSRLCVVQVESRETLRRVLTVGEARPIDTGSTSRVMLAHMALTERVKILSMRRSQLTTPEALFDVDTLVTICDEVLRDGYSYTANQTVHGVAGLSVPILGAEGKLRAVMSISGPQFRLTREVAGHHVVQLKQTACDLGQQLQ